MINDKRLGLLITILLSIVVLYLHYQPYVTDPNNNFFNLYGDGYKNYFTVHYHVKHDATYSHFEGMNYPHGEHIMYTDGQPALSNTLKFISRNIVDVSDYTVGIINVAIVLSFLLCSIFLYLILARLQVAPWFAVLATLGIMLMSPQHYRPIAHYSLSYGFVIPLILYLLLRFEEKATYLLSGLIGVCIGIFGLLHMYYLAILGMLIGWYFLFKFLKNRNWQEVLRLGLHYGIQVILPFALIQLWMISTDPITDRPKTPIGFLDYRAHWEGLITSVHLPYWGWIDKNVLDIRDMSFESEIYLGLVGVIGFFAFVGPLLRRKILPQDGSPNSRYLGFLFPAILLMLFVSLGLPYVLPGLDFLIDYLGPFRQFRGQGRFAWAFYYGWSILLWYLLYQKSRQWTGARKWVLIGGAFLILGLESYWTSTASYLKPFRDEAHYNRQKFETGPGYWFKNVNLQDYQAVLPMPFFHVGSENFVVDAPGDAIRLTTLAAWHYGMGNLGVNMSRTSFSQSIRSIPLDYFPYSTYPIQQDLPNQKPLLVILEKGQYFSSLQGSSYLLRSSKTLFEDAQVQLRELPLDAFGKAMEFWRQDIKAGYEGTLQTGYQRDGFLLPDSSYQFYYRDFDELKSPKQYRGKGAFMGKGRKKVPFVSFQTPAANNECSVWVYLGEDQRPRMNFKAYEIDLAGNEKMIAHNACKFDLQVMDDNGWGLVVFPLNASRAGATVRMELEYRDMNIRDTYVDEFLVRQVGRPQDNIFWRKGEDLIYNNFWFKNIY